VTLQAADPTLELVPIATRQARIQRLQEAAREQGFEALVIFSWGARANNGTHGSLRFLLDWTSWGSATMLVLSTDESIEPTVVVPAPFDPPWMRELCPWLVDVRLEGPPNHGRLARAILTERGIRGRVGLIGADPLPSAVNAELLAPGDWEFAPADLILQRQRMVKDALGLARMRRAAETTDRMFEAAAEVLRHPGQPVWRVQAAMSAAAQLEGAEYVFSWVTAGALPDRTRGRREENVAPLQVGDCVVAAAIIIQGGFYGHTLRTFTIGEPADVHRRVYAAVQEAQDAAAAALRPGLSAAGPTRAAEEAMFRHFPDAREGDRLRFQPCHYIGQDYAEYPTALVSRPPNHGRALGPGALPAGDLALEAGMTIELHPNLRPPGLGLASVGDIFAVTPNGGERLSSYPAELIVIEPA
jgi:Xaa-Pro aminopeptidase